MAHSPRPRSSPCRRTSGTLAARALQHLYGLREGLAVPRGSVGSGARPRLPRRHLCVCASPPVRVCPFPSRSPRSGGTPQWRHLAFKDESRLLVASSPGGRGASSTQPRGGRHSARCSSLAEPPGGRRATAVNDNCRQGRDERLVSTACHLRALDALGAFRVSSLLKPGRGAQSRLVSRRETATCDVASGGRAAFRPDPWLPALRRRGSCSSPPPMGLPRATGVPRPSAMWGRTLSPRARRRQRSGNVTTATPLPTPCVCVPHFGKRQCSLLKGGMSSSGNAVLGMS